MTMDPDLWLERAGRVKGATADEVFPSLEDRTSFTITEVARIFGVTVQAVHLWMSTGRLRGVTRISKRGQYRIPRGEFVRLLRKSKRSVPGLWEDPRARGIKVLFIDDSPQIRRLVEAIAGSPRMPFKVKTAPNVEDGIILAAQWLPDIIFLDYFFAEDRLRGDEALAFIRKAKPIRKVKVVGVSHDPRIGEKMIAAGADGFLRKPFGVAGFRESLLKQIPRAGPR
jgi:CheY-like chemotaxis protein